MLGHSHAVSGALGWLALAPMTAVALDIDLSAAQLAAGTLACAGAALLPDLDHPQATVARFLGPPSQLLSKGVNLLAGGHRMATHSFLFVLLMGVGTQALLTFFGTKAALWTMFIMTALALRGLGLASKKSVMGGLTIAAEAFAITYAVAYFTDGSWGFLPLAVALGCLFHIGGDCCTPERCPIFWPSKKRWGVGIIAHTGNALETKVITPVMSVACFALIWYLFIGPVVLPRLS